MAITNEQEKILRELYPNNSAQFVADVAKISKTQVYRFAKLLGLEKTPEFLNSPASGRRIKGFSQNPLSDHQKAVILNLYATKSSKEIATLANCSISRVYVFAYANGLRKSADFLQSEASGRLQKGNSLSVKNQFKKGQVPFNKGKKLREYVKDEDTLKRILSKSFKKGNLPHNTKYDGAIVVRKDSKSNRRYKWIRITKGSWEMLHVHLYEKEHGPVPDGYALTFKDGDSMNVVLENIELITNAELMKRNTIHNLPEELVDVIRLTGRVKRKVKKLNNGTEQN